MIEARSPSLDSFVCVCVCVFLKAGHIFLLYAPEGTSQT